MAVLDSLGNPIAFSKIFLHQKDSAMAIIGKMLEKEKPGVIVV